MSELITNLGWFLAGAFVMLLVLLTLGERHDSHEFADKQAEPVPPEPTPQPIAAQPEPEPQPAVEPAETVAPMKVIPKWPKPVDGLEPVPVAWRRRLELESAPMFGGLPAHESVWRFDGWNLDDPDRTQMMRIIGGVDADDLDMDLAEPRPLPGFEVDPAARRGLSLSQELIAEVTTSLPSRHRAEVSA